MTVRPRDVHIIGAGFSGMSLALELVSRGCKVHVYDSKPRTGGMIESIPFHGALVETAAHSITRTEKLDRLLNEIGLKAMTPTPTSKRRFILRSGDLRRWPLGLIETVGLIFRFFYAQMRNQARPRTFETLHHWGKRVLGMQATQFLLEPAMQGIYAGDAKSLSSSLLLGPMFNRRKSKKRYSGVVSFQKGVGEIFSAMEKSFLKAGGKLHLGREVSLHELKGTIVVATSIKAAAGLVSEVEPQISSVLSQASMSSLVTVTAHFHRRALHGFGCLIPRGEGPRVLGVLVNSCIFDRKWTVSNESWIYGGAMDPDFVSLSEAEIMKALLDDRKNIFGMAETPKAVHISRWKSALPNYDIHLERALAGLAPVFANLEKTKGLYFHGNYLGGIGLSKILDRGEELAERLMINEKNRPAAE